MADMKTARADLIEALIDLRDEINWTLQHRPEDADALARLVESGEIAGKLRGVAEAGEVLRARIVATQNPDIGEGWPHDRLKLGGEMHGDQSVAAMPARKDGE